nr:hypothetical protein [Mycolicibacterium sp. 018/SC-01/001]
MGDAVGVSRLALYRHHRPPRGALAEAVDPPPPDPSLPGNRERYHDVRVNERRAWSHVEIIDEWRTYTPAQLASLEAGQDHPRAEEPVDVPGLGTFHRHLLANMMAFNVLCHLRYDLLGSDGPLRFALPPPSDETVLPAIEFMLAGLPKMQGPELTATVTEPLVLELTGPGATIVTVAPATASTPHLSIIAGEHGNTRIRSSAEDFIAWATTRTHWRSHCDIDGNPAAATPFLSTLNII